jgi:hypothetical protein
LTVGFFAIVFSAASMVDADTDVDPTVTALGESDDEQATSSNARTATRATSGRLAALRARRRWPSGAAVRAAGSCGRVSGMAYQSSANVPG